MPSFKFLVSLNPNMCVMKSILSVCLGLLVTILATGCDSYSKHTIDEKPQVKADARLLGIWKAVGDTNRFDYFLIQNGEDTHREFVAWMGKHKGEEQDRNEAVKMIVDRYKSGDAKNPYTLYLTRMDQNGTNRHYENFTTTISKIGNATFLNIPYRYAPADDGEMETENEEKGYFFVRILSFNENASLLKVAVVHDPSLKYLSSSAQVRKQIAANMNKPSYYSQTITLYKVSGYHESKKGSITVANKWE